MTLPAQIASPTPILGFDTDTCLNKTTAKQFYQDGYRFCLRYLSLQSSQQPGDLSYDEALNILQAGLALMAVQHVRSAGWEPTASMGTTDGNNAANNAKTIGLPPGVNIWCDLEGIHNSVDANKVISYCNNWFDAVATQGYVPGLYVGASAILTGQQLYQSLKFQHYWKSASKVPQVPSRGYQLVQFAPDITVNGINIDKNSAQRDLLGGQVLWLIDNEFERCTHK